MPPIAGVILLVLVAAAFFYLAIRAFGVRRPAVKWPATVLAGLVGLVAGVLGVVGVIGFITLNVPRSNPAPDMRAGGTSEEMARAGRFANGCAGCHSTSGVPPLDGGAFNFGEEIPAFGTLVAPNLTPAGEIRDWSDGEVIRAIREGIDKDGRPLLLMPSESFHAIADRDVQALVAFLRSQPPVENDTPPREMTLMGLVLVGAGMFPTAAQAPITEPVAAPPHGPTPAYGRYLVGISGCSSCHGANLQGGEAGFGPPPGPHLGAAANWTESQFITAIRRGTVPDGRQLTDAMPWRDFAAMFTDEELRAIQGHLREALGP